MKSSRIRLFKNHMHGIGYWDIWFVDNVIHIEHSQCVGCSAIHHQEVVKEGKQNRTLQQQVISRIKSRINKQLDKGYVRTMEEAKSPPTNTMNLLQPMLALALKRGPKFDLRTSYVQPKLDGHRCLITKQNGVIQAYSRQGKPITSIKHILENMEVDEGVTIDGELYLHGVPLQTIGSWVKREQEDTKKLQYNIFDVVSDEPFKDRLQTMNKLNIDDDNVVLVGTVDVSKMPDYDLSDHFKIMRGHGYEGLIIRQGNKGYEAGRRSGSLLKVKEMFDDEFEVVGVTASVEGWGVLHCITKDAKVFRTSAPGTKPQKREVLENLEDYVGKFVTVEFSQLTKDGIPFHPVAVRWREDI